MSELPNHFPPATDETAPLKLPNSVWLRSSPGSCIFTLSLALVFALLFAHRPLWHTDLWDHINYGLQILDTKSLAETEPLLPLAEGESMVQTAWGAQAVMAAVFRAPWLGLAGLQFGNALMVVTSIGAIGWAVWKRTQSVMGGILASLVFLAVNWQQFLVIRPQLVGVMLFSLLLAMLSTSLVRRRLIWVAVPVMFLTWANLHGSFVMGLTLLGLFTTGRFAEAAWRTGSFNSGVRCRPAWTLVGLTHVAAFVALLNPHGFEIYTEVLRVGAHPNISSMYEWDALSLSMKQGKVAAAISVMLLIVMWFSPRRIRFPELFTLLATGVLAIWSSRMLNWFAPVAGLVLATHAAAIGRRLIGGRRNRTTAKPRVLWTLVNIGLCWICFVNSPLGWQTVTGTPPKSATLLTRATPIAVGDLLASNPQLRRGIVFVPAEWAGYLTNVCDGDLRPMVNLHVHVVPVDVWNNYLQIMAVTPDWNSLLDGYSIQVVVTDRRQQWQLTDELYQHPNFELLYADEQAAVFQRR